MFSQYVPRHVHHRHHLLCSTVFVHATLKTGKSANGSRLTGSVFRLSACRSGFLPVCRPWIFQPPTSVLYGRTCFCMISRNFILRILNFLEISVNDDNETRTERCQQQHQLLYPNPCHGMAVDKKTKSNKRKENRTTNEQRQQSTDRDKTKSFLVAACVLGITFLLFNTSYKFLSSTETT